MTHQYFVYITTNKNKTTLYVGVTNDLYTRMQQHLEQSYRGKTFAGKYQCVNLVYWERHNNINHAIEREKEIKGWRREKKEALIATQNPDWHFLNDEL